MTHSGRGQESRASRLETAAGGRRMTDTEGNHPYGFVGPYPDRRNRPRRVDLRRDDSLGHSEYRLQRASELLDRAKDGVFRGICFHAEHLRNLFDVAAFVVPQDEGG